MFDLNKQRGASRSRHLSDTTLEIAADAVLDHQRARRAELLATGELELDDEWDAPTVIEELPAAPMAALVGAS
jgi:hypothetical protein